jgi:CheY-like chemotaxis protein
VTEQPKILVVDDDGPHRAAAVDVLRGGGFAVVEAASGRVALDYLLGAAAPPRLILAGLNMPGTASWEMVSVLRHYLRFASVPIVIVTSESVPAQTFDQLEVHQLPKPYAPAQLLALVHAIVSSS